MKWDPPIRPIESGPLTDREIKELHAFLLAEDSLENPMDFYTFDGFICAVLSGPNTIMPSEWLRWVWDQKESEQPPEFTSEKQAKRILSLLIGHANVLALALIHGPQYYEPRFYAHKIEGNSVPIVDEWCCGYVKGIALDPEGWQPLIDARPDWFEVIHLYGTQSGWERLKELVDAHEDSVARHQAFVDRIAPAACNIHADWLARRAPRERLRQHNKAPVPGRNDPCPCGSGKTFKRCHGAPDVALLKLWQSKSLRYPPSQLRRFGTLATASLQRPPFFRPFQFFDQTGSENSLAGLVTSLSCVYDDRRLVAGLAP